MLNKEALNVQYKRALEDDIINYLAEVKSIKIREALDIYYSSKLAQQIEEGAYGIENMDYKYLVNDLIENESELFANQSPSS